MIWGYLLHLGYNMWSDRECDAEFGCTHVSAKPYLRFDDSLYDALLTEMANAGINLVVLDIGEGVRYESHPEIAVEGAWTTGRLREELAKMRSLGLEPIPKLNFSAAHDAWLGEYARMVSTPAYYRVCADLISETCALFETPRFFHLGMDEETSEHQKWYAFSYVRQHDLWWHDLNFYLAQVKKAGVRPWVWSDYIWNHNAEYLAKMPTSVLQSNWYYGNDFTPENVESRAYLDLATQGYDQIPTACTNPRWADDANFASTVSFCREHIAPQHLVGFLQSVWRPTLEEFREAHLNAIRRVAEIRSVVEQTSPERSAHG